MEKRLLVTTLATAEADQRAGLAWRLRAKQENYTGRH
jgi:hypothetical protein